MQLPGGETIEAPDNIPTGGLDTLSYALVNGLSLLIIVAIILSLIFIVMAGVQWSASGGDKGKVAQARARMTWAVIGLILALAVFFIISVIGSIFGVELL